MVKVETKSGYIAYKVSRSEILMFGGAGVCDNCIVPPDNGFLIPVLNQWYCPECFAKWDANAIFHSEDIPVQEKNATYYERVIPLHGHLAPFALLPAPEGTCPECATKHEQGEPHNQQSLAYQYYFYDRHSRWPTWLDAMAHCSQYVKEVWIEALKMYGIEVDELQGMDVEIEIEIKVGEEAHNENPAYC